YLMLTPLEYREVVSISAAKALLPEASTVSCVSTIQDSSSDSGSQESRTPANQTPTMQECNSNCQSSASYEDLLHNSGSSLQMPVEYPTHQMCSGSKGLLSKIVDALKKETTGSTFRYSFVFKHL
ncbi:hypothetical protein SK128_021040, partial [Halocaridina rubra]